MSEPGERPLVSVLMASRNGSRFLGEALESLRAQSWRRLEIVVVDDGSTDETPAILERFARSHAATRVLRSEGIGLAGALARAATQARGELFARHDDDDRSDPRRVEEQVSFLLGHPEIGLVGTGASLIDERGEVVARVPVPTTAARIRATLRRAPPFVHGSVLIRREVYERAGGYRTAFQATQDYDLWLRIPRDAGLANLAAPLYQWRLHAGGVFSRARETQLRYQALARAFADERREQGRDSIELLERCDGFERFLAEYPRAGLLHFYLGETLVRNGRLAEARAHLAEALRRGGPRGAALQWLALSWAVRLVRPASAARATGAA